MLAFPHGPRTPCKAMVGSDRQRVCPGWGSSDPVLLGACGDTSSPSPGPGVYLECEVVGAFPSLLWALASISE